MKAPLRTRRCRKCGAHTLLATETEGKALLPPTWLDATPIPVGAPAPEVPRTYWTRDPSFGWIASERPEPRGYPIHAQHMCADK